MYHGIINVYKEAGFTSHDVVARLRGICKQKKIGHTGTLDPDAVGVLPVCLGNGTRLCDLLADRTKEYIALLRLGTVTDTQDSSGRVLEEKPADMPPERVREVIASFEGSSMQIPPMYSALKVNGKKLYELARKGVEVERRARPITIYSLEILEEAHPEYTFRVECSKGTYIRTLCHDIGQALGCGGLMAALKRTRVGEFGIENAHSLTELQSLADEGRLSEVIIPVDRMFSGLPALTVKESGMRALRNGNQLRQVDLENGLWEFSGEMQEQKFRVYSPQGIFFGIYAWEMHRELFCPVKLFLPDAQ